MARWLDVLQNDDDVRPAPPASGIPAQRLPPTIRRTLQLAALPLVLLDVAAQKLVRLVFRPRWRLTGGCERTGSCCRYISQHSSSGGLLVGRGADRLLRWWATEVNGFYVRPFVVEAGVVTDGAGADGEGAEVVVYSCRHLTAEGSCDNYRLRPMLCRMWPRVDFFSKPSLHKGCGYSASERRAPVTKPDAQPDPQR